MAILGHEKVSFAAPFTSCLRFIFLDKPLDGSAGHLKVTEKDHRYLHTYSDTLEIQANNSYGFDYRANQTRTLRSMRVERLQSSKSTHKSDS